VGMSLTSDFCRFFKVPARARKVIFGPVCTTRESVSFTMTDLVDALSGNLSKHVVKVKAATK
jgi:hypothetical protein